MYKIGNVNNVINIENLDKKVIVYLFCIVGLQDAANNISAAIIRYQQL
jgi:hypothetical protein